MQVQQSYHPKYGVVTVLQAKACLSKIATVEGRDFWVPNNMLNQAEFERRQKKVDGVMARCKRDTQMAAGIDPECSRQDLVNRLLNNGKYTLRLDATEEGIEVAQAEYISWTGESFPEELITLEQDRPQARRWHFEFEDEPGATYPFPVISAGSQETPYARLKTGARGLYRAGRIRMDYAEEVERLIRIGLRAQ